MLVGVVDGLSGSGADGIGDDPGVGRAVDFLGKSDVANGLFDLLGQNLGPDGTGNSGAERRTDVVSREVQT